ncbi:YDG domain-containing protein [Sulfurivermis fontis]|uniref:YDG domain-containing protein n=1 Tax=Sulfurivermis fontis TaxID=1972068 RepID=UPI0015598351|nr:YDG domain-containing protein [Sulfurivermis fontis]
MNRAYRLVWSDRLRAFVAVAEFARARGKRASSAVLAAGLIAVLPGLSLAANLPEGGRIVAGSGSITQSGNTMTVSQSTDRLAADWQSFSIGQGYAVNFVQPSSSAIALNRVLGSDVSRIQGSLTANGQVFLVNPNGVLFSPTARVEVGGLVASTRDLSVEDFMAGNYRFSGSGNAAIRNEGDIKVSPGGTAAFIAARIENVGRIEAPQGNVLMAAADTVRLDLGGPVKLEVEKGALDALIAQGGAILADGGRVLLTAQAADELTAAVINHTGITEAKTLATGEQGEIILLADMKTGQTNAAGALKAAFVETSAAKVALAPDLEVDTQGGAWLIDPVDVEIDAAAAAAIQTGLQSGDVTVSTAGAGADAGDITVGAPIAWSSHVLTLRADDDIAIRAALTSTGATANDGLRLQYAQTTASGDYTIDAPVNLAAGSLFQTQKGSEAAATYTVITDIAALQNINGDLAGNYALGADVEYVWQAGTTFTPLGGHAAGGSTAEFTGRFDGLGHTISALSIEMLGTRDKVGVFGQTQGAQIRNLTLGGLDIAGERNVGALIGYAQDTAVTNVHLVDGSVRGTADHVGGLIGQGLRVTLDGVSVDAGSAVLVEAAGSDVLQNVGGLAGTLISSTVQNASSAARVQASNFNGIESYVWNVGGLVGNFRRSGPADTALIADSHATGAVIADASYEAAYVGGLVGRSTYADITRAWAAGNVSGHHHVGGLVGQADAVESGGVTYGSISQAYAEGNVTASGDAAGGLMGENWGVVSDVYATGDVTGNDAVGGIAGRNWGALASISRAWSSGKVTGTGNLSGVGGLVGVVAHGASLSESYWDSETAGLVSRDPLGLIPPMGCGYFISSGSCDDHDLTTADALKKASYAGFDFANTWFMLDQDGHFRPLLRMEWSDTIANAHQLQLMAMNQDASYVLANDIELDAYFQREGRANIWATGLDGGGNPQGPGFSPIGQFVETGCGPGGCTQHPELQFGGRFDGRGHVVSGLYIDRPDLEHVGLFGMTRDAGVVIENVGIDGGQVKGGNVTGKVGALVGMNSGTVRNAWAGAEVSSGGEFAAVGGLVGTVTSDARIENAYATGNVSASGGTSAAGGLAGANGGVIRNAHATGNVSGYQAGGLIGSNFAHTADVSYTYASGSVTGTIAGGLVGVQETSSSALGGITHSFWDTVTTGQSNGYGGGAVDGTFSATGLSTAGMQNPFSFIDDGWDFDGVWAKALHDGVNGGYMVLRDLQPNETLYSAYVRVSDGQNLGRAYGSTDTAATGLAMTGARLADLTASWGSAVTPTANAGTVYNLADANVLAFAHADGGPVWVDSLGDGTLTITPKVLTISGSSAADKTYDGTTNATVTPGMLSGLVGSETLGVSATGAFADKNAGTNKNVSVIYTLADGANGGLASNYTLVNETLTADITAKALTISGMTAQNKVYDGTTGATLSGGSLDGVISGDTVSFSGATGAFADKNVGTGKSVTVSGTTLSGADAGNYTVTDPTGLTADITPKALTASYTASNKVYDGTTAATVNATSGDIVTGDTVMIAASGTFTDKNAGTGKTVTVSGGALSGADAGNYALQNPTDTASADITPRPVVVTADAKSKTEGQLDPALTYTTGCAAGQTTNCGLVTGETLTGSLARDPGEAVGSYAIQQGTVTDASNPNYAISYVGADLSITASGGGGSGGGGSGGGGSGGGGSGGGGSGGGGSGGGGSGGSLGQSFETALVSVQTAADNVSDAPGLGSRAFGASPNLLVIAGGIRLPEGILPDDEEWRRK